MKKQVQIYEFIRYKCTENSRNLCTFSKADIAKEMKIHRNTVGYCIAELIQNGQIIQHGEHWALPPKINASEPQITTEKSELCTNCAECTNYAQTMHKTCTKWEEDVASMYNLCTKDAQFGDKVGILIQEIQQRIQQIREIAQKIPEIEQKINLKKNATPYILNINITRKKSKSPLVFEDAEGQNINAAATKILLKDYVCPHEYNSGTPTDAAGYTEFAAAKIYSYLAERLPNDKRIFAMTLDGAVKILKSIKRDGGNLKHLIWLFGWINGDSPAANFWKPNIRGFQGLSKKGKNGAPKYVNALASMKRELSQDADREHRQRVKDGITQFAQRQLQWFDELPD